jgi:hypothetical protein
MTLGRVRNSLARQSRPQGAIEARRVERVPPAELEPRHGPRPVLGIVPRLRVGESARGQRQAVRGGALWQRQLCRPQNSRHDRRVRPFLLGQVEHLRDRLGQPVVHTERPLGEHVADGPHQAHRGVVIRRQRSLLHVRPDHVAEALQPSPCSATRSTARRDPASNRHARRQRATRQPGSRPTAVAAVVTRGDCLAVRKTRQ